MGKDAFISRTAVLATALLAVVVPGASAALPNDPMLGRQWQLAAPAVLGAPEAWGQSQGQGVTVAVLDTGARLDHPDLAPNLWTNSGEIAGNNVDDDRDGFVDDVHGVDLINHDGDPSDDDGHGTHVAGIIGARAGNGIGIAGVAPRATLMIVKVLDGQHNGTGSTVAEGIRYAIAHGASIVNASINGDGQSTALQEAIRAANTAGVTIVASAGNDHRNLDLTPSYPASYTDPNVIGVGATGTDGVLSAFSNLGLSAVDVVAPGVDILSTASNGDYELRSGTSMAAPEVSGALALAQAAGASPAGARAALLGSLRRLPVVGTLLGGGALDLAAMLRQVVPAPAWHGSATPLSVVLTPSATRRAGRTRLQWALTGDASGVASLQVKVDGRDRGGKLDPAARSAAPALGKGRHVIRVAALDAAGNELTSAQTAFSLKSAARRAR